LSPEVAEVAKDKLAVLAQEAGDLLHGIDAAAHSLQAPLIEKLSDHWAEPFSVDVCFLLTVHLFLVIFF
jgi:hypothetical protein